MHRQRLTLFVNKIYHFTTWNPRSGNLCSSYFGHDSTATHNDFVLCWTSLFLQLLFNSLLLGIILLIALLLSLVLLVPSGHMNAKRATECVFGCIVPRIVLQRMVPIANFRKMFVSKMYMQRKVGFMTSTATSHRGLLGCLAFTFVFYYSFLHIFYASDATLNQKKWI